jgi:hypothetical protein
VPAISLMSRPRKRRVAVEEPSGAGLRGNTGRPKCSCSDWPTALPCLWAMMGQSDTAGSAGAHGRARSPSPVVHGRPDRRPSRVGPLHPVARTREDEQVVARTENGKIGDSASERDPSAREHEGPRIDRCGTSAWMMVSAKHHLISSSAQQRRRPPRQAAQPRDAAGQE